VQPGRGWEKLRVGGTTGIHGKEVARGLQHAGGAHAMAEKDFVDVTGSRGADEPCDAAALRAIVGSVPVPGIDAADF